MGGFFLMKIYSRWLVGYKFPNSCSHMVHKTTIITTIASLQSTFQQILSKRVLLLYCIGFPFKLPWVREKSSCELSHQRHQFWLLSGSFSKNHLDITIITPNVPLGKMQARRNWGQNKNQCRYKQKFPTLIFPLTSPSQLPIHLFASG